MACNPFEVGFFFQPWPKHGSRLRSLEVGGFFSGGGLCEISECILECGILEDWETMIQDHQQRER